MFKTDQWYGENTKQAGGGDIHNNFKGWNGGFQNADPVL